MAKALASLHTNSSWRLLPRTLGLSRTGQIALQNPVLSSNSSRKNTPGVFA